MNKTSLQTQFQLKKYISISHLFQSLLYLVSLLFGYQFLAFDIYVSHTSGLSEVDYSALPLNLFVKTPNPINLSLSNAPKAVPPLDSSHSYREIIS